MGLELGDFAFNLIGSGMLVAQELAWDEQKIQFKWSAHYKHYDNSLKPRADEIFGQTTPSV
jgi:hypothetical protein